MKGKRVGFSFYSFCRCRMRVRSRLTFLGSISLLDGFPEHEPPPPPQSLPARVTLHYFVHYICIAEQGSASGSTSALPCRHPLFGLFRFFSCCSLFAAVDEEEREMRCAAIMRRDGDASSFLASQHYLLAVYGMLGGGTGLATRFNEGGKGTMADGVYAHLTSLSHLELLPSSASSQRLAAANLNCTERCCTYIHK
ncbi:uncharacterized protein LY89DRAFT_31592 [Mollisia scopiformis]|uniref:Uncharacterized protein n=1 Tax=Mollisia scopiformis TaxID=149040 RepID=A0A194XDU9_MOLSC|nr:uncharacterized protein LY89DRAFT_31592 [Mollisia scopiformis]KUJ17922.1 hypothetical protein LY89DRAFT_31592 [Mollisia scopiformis]